MLNKWFWGVLIKWDDILPIPHFANKGKIHVLPIRSVTKCEFLPLLAKCGLAKYDKNEKKGKGKREVGYITFDYFYFKEKHDK